MPAVHKLGTVAAVAMTLTLTMAKSAPGNGPAPATRFRTQSACKNQNPVTIQGGALIATSDLRGVDFFTRTEGVGVTFPLLACSSSGVASYPAWLVVSKDAGQTWRVVGGELPRWLGPGASTPVFTSLQRGWLDAGGQLAFTVNGARTWEKVKLNRDASGSNAIQLVASGHDVAAMVGDGLSGVLQVWRLSPTGTQAVAEPALGTPVRLQAQSLEIVPGTGQLVVVQAYAPVGSATVTARIFLIAPDEARWQAIPPPRCGLGGLAVVVPAGGQTLAAVCGEPLGMMHESKAFYLSGNDGRTWHEQSQMNAWKSGPSAMPFSDLIGLATSSPSTYYMATSSALGVSYNGGRTWTQIYWGGGGLSEMTTSFVDGRHGWILLPHAALLRTSDGKHWAVLPAS